MELVRKQSVAWRQIRDEFLEAQGGNCPLCGAPPEKPCLDHCHQDGFIRGTLCGPCNVMLGWYEANRQAIETYLAKAAEFQAYQVIPSRSRAQARSADLTDEAPQRIGKSWLEYWASKERPAKPQGQAATL